MSGLTIWVTGRGRPQGSKNAFPVYAGKKGEKKFTGRTVVQEVSKDVKVWRGYIKGAAEKAIADSDERFPFPEGPMVLHVIFYQFRPKNHFRSGRYASLLKENAPTAPTVSPDLSKLIRATEDALTDAGVWYDDKLVARIIADKAYVSDDVESPRPGAIIHVYPFGG